jgi:hypothetical protein
VRGLELVEEPVDRECVVSHPRFALRPAAGVDEIAVVVPFEVGDGVLVDQRVQVRRNVRIRVGVRQVEHLLLSR